MENMENAEIDIEAIRQKIEKIAEACSKDTGRGISALAGKTRDDLFRAAASIATHEHPHIALVTGFYIPGAPVPAAETDGPVGTAHLAAGLITAGIPVRVITDAYCYDAVKAALEYAGIEALTPIHRFPVDELPEVNDHIIKTIIGDWETEKPPVSHVISIERAGPAADGLVYNMRGEDITVYTPPLYKLFTSTELRATIGIGDGGNEIGMGKLAPGLISENIENGDKIACTVPCDYLVVSGVSNWGCYALLAALSLLIPHKADKLLKTLSLKNDHLILTGTVQKGKAIDGVTHQNTVSVDGLGWEKNAKVLEEILEICQAKPDTSVWKHNLQSNN